MIKENQSKKINEAHKMKKVLMSQKHIEIRKTLPSRKKKCTTQNINTQRMKKERKMILTSLM